MDNPETEPTILERAIEAFQRITGIRPELERPAMALHMLDKTDPDALLHLRLPNGRGIGPFAVEVKRRLDRANLGQILLQTQRTGLPTVIATEYVNPRMAETLNAKNIPFLDTAGNALINADDVFVYVTGRKVPTEQRRAKPPTRAFRTTGLKLILAILNDPPLLNAKYREIAYVTDVALGTITNVFKDLEELGFLQTIGDHRRLRKFEELVHKWADAYIEKTREKLVIGRYTGEFAAQWPDADLTQLDAWWGGETAAAKITGYLRPETTTIYVKPPAGRVQAKLGLRKDPKGNVELLKAFWPAKMNMTRRDCAPFIVVYADLLAIGDDRTIETARMLYEKYIAIDRR
jgi:hypothetical protein